MRRQFFFTVQYFAVDGGAGRGTDGNRQGCCSWRVLLQVQIHRGLSATAPLHRRAIAIEIGVESIPIPGTATAHGAPPDLSRPPTEPCRRHRPHPRLSNSIPPPGSCHPTTEYHKRLRRDRSGRPSYVNWPNNWSLVSW